MTKFELIEIPWAVQVSLLDFVVVYIASNVQWATKVMTPASMYFLWKQGS